MSAHEIDILRKFGIKVPKTQVGDFIAMINNDPELSKEMEKIEASLGTMRNEDLFIQCITLSSKNIAELPENSKVIQNRENTFVIQAINPQNIKSLTERAFFNSFNLQRNVLNDLEEETKIHKNTSYRPNEKQQRNDNNQHRNRVDNDEEEKCICGKNIPGSEWVQCGNEEKCRGSNWYHLECAGLDSTDIDNVKDNNFNFTCELCKKEEMDDDSSGLRKRRRGDDSGK